MGKGPGTIYKDCIAEAIQMDKFARSMNDKVTLLLNTTTGYCCLLEQDINGHFLDENYGERAREKALSLWADANRIMRKRIQGYRAIVFLDAITSITGVA